MTIRINKTTIFLSIIFALGLFLRLYKLEFQSLWNDEYYTLSLATRNFDFSLANFDYLPPISILILKLWINIVPVTETSIRIPQAIIGALTIPLFFYFVKNLFNEKTALWSSCFLAISAVHIEYCQESKYYALKIFMAILTQFLFFKAIRTDKKIYYSGYAISFSLAIYSYYYLFILFIIQTFFLLIFFKKYKNIFLKIIISQLFVLLISIPILISILNVSWIQNYVSWIAPLSISSIISPIIKIHSCKNFYRIFIHKIPIIKILAPILCIWTSLIFINISVKFKHKLPENIIFTIIWALTPIIFFLGFSKLFFPMFITRYILLTVPALIILWGYIVNSSKDLWCKLIFIFLIISINSTSLIFYYNHPVRHQFRESINFLSNNIRKSDKILFNGPSYETSLVNYYFKKNNKKNDIYQINDNANFTNFNWIIDRTNNIESTKNIHLKKTFFGIKIFKITTSNKT